MRLLESLTPGDPRDYGFMKLQPAIDSPIVPQGTNTPLRVTWREYPYETRPVDGLTLDSTTGLPADRADQISVDLSVCIAGGAMKTPWKRRLLGQRRDLKG